MFGLFSQLLRFCRRGVGAAGLDQTVLNTKGDKKPQLLGL